MDRNNAIFRHWGVFSELANPVQSEYFKRKIKVGKTIKCVKLEDVFTRDEIAHKIIPYVRAEKNMCFRTAYRLTNLFPDRVKYVEGEVEVLNGGLGIEHAWNLVDGEHYVDLTFELALGEDVTTQTYVALGAYDVDVIRDVACETMVYGGVYDRLYLREIKNKKSKTKKTRK